MRPGMAVMAALLMAGCASRQPLRMAKPAAETPALLAISRVGVSPKTIDVARGEAAAIRYELSHPAVVRVDLVNEAGQVIRALEAGSRPAGPHATLWDGLMDDSRPAFAGVYRYVIRATDAQGNEAVYDSSGQTGGEELTVRDFTFDKDTRMFRWIMPRAGYARLRAGVEGFPHLRTLLDWEPLEAGPQELRWDGLDSSGLIKVADHPNRSLKLTAFAIPDNTIIVRGIQSARPQSTLGTDSSIEDRPSSMSYPPLVQGPSAYFHARHDRDSCREVGFTVTFPEADRRSPEGYPVLSGRVPVRVAVDDRDAARIVNQRFEIVLYEDLTLLFEEEESLNPFTFLWDTSKLPPGTHLLTVNVLTYDDHYGVMTTPIMVEHTS